MARRFHLQPLLDLAQDRVDAATQNLAVLKQRWQSQEDKLAQLYGYQAEYRERLASSMTLGLDIGRIQDFHAFLHKLDLAIRRQKLEVQQAKFQWEQSQQIWQEEQRKLKTYDVLKQRHERAEAHRENRLDQRNQDEFARNRSSRRHTESDPE